MADRQEKGNRWKNLTKTQKIIVISAAVLITITILFVPYRTIESTLEMTSPIDNRIITQIRTIDAGYDLIFSLALAQSIKSTEDDLRIVSQKTIIQFDILSLEIFGILVLAGAAFLVTKKR